MTDLYWGPFKDIVADPTEHVEEIRPFEGLAVELYDQMAVADWDESEYLVIAADCVGSVLELGCGTGRILLRFAEAGHLVTGLDRSLEMLAVLESRLATMPDVIRSRVTLVCEDATHFDLEKSFALVLLPYLTLGLFSGRAAQTDVIRGAARHLADGGLFVFDYLTVLDGPSASIGGEIVERDFCLRGQRLPGQFGAKFFEEERTLVVNACWNQQNGDGRTRRYLMTMGVQVFEPAEIDQLLDAAGLVIVKSQSREMGDGVTRRTLVTCRQKVERKDPLWHPYWPKSELSQNSLTLVEGSGCEVVDNEGRRYIDASGGLWSVQCGLGREEIIDAITQQLQRLSYATLFLGRANEAALALARRLVAMVPRPLESVYLTGSGSESIELAIKLARTFFALQGRPEKKAILYLDASYHGTFFGSIGVSGLVPEKDIFGPLLPGLASVPRPSPTTVPTTLLTRIMHFGAQLFSRRCLMMQVSTSPLSLSSPSSDRPG